MKQFYKSITYLFIFAIIFLMGCTKDIDIEDQFDFDFEITVPTEGFVYETAPFDVKIKPQRVVNGTSYKLSYTIEKGKSHLETKSPTIAIKASEEYIMPDKFEQVFNYIPTEVGTNIIIVSIEDNHGVIKTKKITFESKYAPFTYLLTPNLSTYTINAKGAMTSTLIRKEEDKFKFKYIVTNGTGIFYDGDTAITPGEDYVLKNGVQQLHYMPSTLGLHKIAATATASDNASITRQIEVSVDNVPFTLSTTAATTSLNVNQELVISVDLTEQIRTNGVTYEISHSYDPKGISGVMKNPSGVAVQAGKTDKIVPGSYQYRFKPSGIGTATITFKIVDSNGQIKESTVVITVENVPFSFTSIPSEKTILLNKATVLNFNLATNASETNGLTYKLVYTPVEGDGTLTTTGGTVLKSGTPIDIEKGTFNFNYIPKSLGNHKLDFVVTDNNGQQRTGTIEMNTTHTPVTFNVSSVTQTYVNQSIPINFTITPQNSADLDYKMNYYVSGGDGPLKNQGTVITPGNYIDVSKGSFQYSYTPTIAGNYVFTFELKDSNGQIVTKELTVVVLNNKFTFTPTPSQYVYVNEDNVFNYALVPTGNYANTTYNVSYSIESGQLGSFYQETNQIQQGIPITVIPTAFKLIYKPTSVGTHKIHYVVTDSNGLKEDISQEVKVVASGYNFSTQQSNTKVYKNTTDQLILSLTQEQNNPRIKYTISYSITGVGTVLENGVPLVSGSEITPGNKNYSFISDQSGNSKIDFKITDSNGVSQTKTINYTVVNADFTLSTTGDGTLNLGKSKAVNYFISQVVTDKTASYQVRFLLDGTGSGVMLNNGVEIPYGTFSDSNIGVTNLQFKGTQVGPVNVKVEVKDSNGVTHTSSIAFSVVEIAYTFTGASQSNTIFITASTNLNFDITETAPSDTQYEIKYTFTKGGGIIRNGGKEILANQWESVNIGSFNRSFGATIAGENIIEFTVRNKTTSIEKKQSIKIDVTPSEYTFSASSTSNNELTKTPVNVNFNINQVGGGADTYTMFFTTNGKGTFVYNNITYTSGQPITFFNGPSTGKYIGTSGGDHDLNFSVINQDGKQKSQNVKISYINNDFTLSSSGDGSLNVNSDKNFNVFLSQNANDNAITYQVKYTIASGSVGNGNLYKEGSLVSLGNFETISKGTTQLTFSGTEVGLVTINVEVKDSNGISHTSTLNFNVKGISYTFSGAPQDNSIFVTATTNLNFDLSETAASGTAYEMKYAITDGNAEIKNGSRTILANQWESVNIGSFNRTFVGTTTGTIKVLFTVRNKTSLVEKTQLITVVVSPSDYNFTATGTTNNQITKTPVNVNFNVNQIGGGIDTYEMAFTTSGTGTFTYNGVEYTAGQVIPFVKGASNGQYIGTTGGAHDISFTITNQDAKSRTATVKLNYINNDFALSSSGDGSLNVNTSKTFNVFLSQGATDPAITYEVKYTIAQGAVGNGTITKSGVVVPFGTFQAITTGTTEFVFNGISEGVVAVIAEVKDSNGISHTSTLNFNVKGISYAFSGAPQDNKIFVTASTNLNFDVSETAASGTAYEMKYAITEGNAEIKNGSRTILANQWEEVSVGSFNRTFVGTTEGTIKVLFTVRNKTSLVEKTQLITVVVSPSDYTFIATGTTNNQITKTPVNVNFNVNQIGGGIDTYEMAFTTSGTGTFTYNGVEYTAGQVIPFVKGASNGQYIGTTGGTHDVLFTVTNQNAKSKSAPIKLTYANNDFTLSTSGDGSLNVNTSKTFNVFLSQGATDPAITYEVKYTIAQGAVGNGTITKSGVVVPFGTFQAITTGTTEFVFNGISEGVVAVLAEVKDSNGISHTSTLNFNVKGISYAFSGAPQDNSIFVTASTNLNFDVSETAASGTAYEMKYAITEGNAEIKNGSRTILANQWEEVSVGSFNRTFVGTTEGTIKVLFTVRNKTSLVEKTQLITVVVSPSDYTFIATGTTNNQITKTPVNVNFNVNQIGGGIDTYEMTFTTTGTGTFTYNGGEYTAGQVIPFVKGASNGQYIGTTGGVHEILFTVTNQNAKSKSAPIKLTYANNDFTLSTSGDGSLNINTTKNFNAFLSQGATDTGITYQVKYTFAAGTIGDGTLTNGATPIALGTFLPISVGTTSPTFKGIAPGIVNILVTVQDSNGITHNSTVVFDVKAIDYSFSGATQQNSIYITESTPLNFVISETGETGTAYEMKYAITSGVAQIKNGTAVENANTWYPVTVGSFNRSFVGTTTGSVVVLFTVRNKTTLVEKTQSITVNVAASVFTFTATGTTNNLITGTPINVNFNLTQTGGATDVYNLTFSTTGTGTFTYKGVEYTAGEVIPFVVGASNGTYKGTTGGAHDITFTATNQSNASKTAIVKLTYANNDFTLSTSGDGSLNINTTKNFNAFLSQATKDPSITYEVKYTFATGTIGDGTLTNGAAPIALGTFLPISVGTTSPTFKGTAPGIVNILVTVQDSNGITHTSTVAFDVKAIDYSFTGATQQNNIYITESTPLNFVISETGETGTAYEMKYAITSGVAQIKNGSTVENANTWYPVTVGSFNRTFVGTTTGSVAVLFTVRNKTTLVEKTQSITVSVAASEFAFTATGTTNNQVTGTPVNVNFNINQTGGASDTYKMAFSSTGTGTFTYNGISYTAGEIIPFVVGASNGTYKGTTGGAHDITFTATNQSNASKTAIVKLTYANNDFTLSTSGDGSLNINTTKSFNTFLSQATKDPSITYEVKYTFATGTIGDGTLTNGAAPITLGTFIPISVGTTAPTFKGTAPGIVNILVTVQDSNGLIHTSTVVFDVKAIDYSFTGATQQNSIYITESTPFNFVISETGETGTAYEMKYAITSGVAQIKNGSTVENANTWYPVTVGSFNRTFVGTTTGSVVVLFTVRNKTTLVEKTQSIAVNVAASEFAFTATGTSNNQVTGTPVNVNFNINQTGGATDVYNLTFNTTGTGTFTYNGITYTAGQVIPFVVGASNGTYKGTTGGAHDITFTATNQSNASKTAIVKLTYANNDFTLSSSGDGSLNISESKDFNIFLSQNTPDNTINYEVKYTIASGSTGNGTITKSGVIVPFGTFETISKGTTPLIFNGTSPGKINITAEVKDSNGITHTSTVAFDVKAIDYSFSGAPQENAIYVNGTTPITFDVTETAPSGTNYEIKYALVQGNAVVKNGALTMTANTWQPANVGSFNRTFVGTTTGTIKVLFTVRNKTTLVEKTETVTVLVNPSEFTFNATRANNDQVVNTKVDINFNLTQTGGTADTYKLTFTTSSTGTFTYNGVEYTAGQIIPFVEGASTGSYKGTKAGKHDLKFTATNQINDTKSADVSVNFINNDFTLSSSGDGTMFVNQTKDLTLFLSQLIPDSSINYEVKYSFDSGTVGNGTLTNAGNTISLGSYQPISLNSTPLVFKATTFGRIYLLVEVKNSNGLMKSSTIMIDIKNADFIFTGGAQSNVTTVNTPAPLSFELSEVVPSGTDYEMSYNITQGTATLRDGATNLTPFTWYPISVANFTRDLVPTSQGNVTAVITVRNKVTLQTKNVTIVIQSYQKPVLTNIRTGMRVGSSYNCGGGSCDRDYDYLLSFSSVLNSGATIANIKLSVADTNHSNTMRTFVITNFVHNFSGYIQILHQGWELSEYWEFNNKPYTLVVTDSNGYSNTYTGTFTNSESDFQ